MNSLTAWLIEYLADEAESAVARALTVRMPRRERRGGQALPPGPDTPLWNELVRQVLPLLRQRGSQAALARVLGLPRQRVYVCLKAGKGCFDAERTLLLVGWLAAKKSRSRIQRPKCFPADR